MSALRMSSAPSALVSSWSWAAKGKSRALPANWIRTVSTTSASHQAAPATSSNAAAGASNTLATSGSAPSKDSAAQASAPTSSISSTQSAISLLKSQPAHYIVASIVGRTMMLTPRDVFTIPRLRDVEVGDVIELERIHEVGSRDYTLRAQESMSTRKAGGSSIMRSRVAFGGEEVLQEAGQPQLKESSSWATRLLPSGLAHVGAVLPTSTVRARCVVVEHTKGALEKILHFKKRKGYKKYIKHKQTYTRLRLEGIKFGDGH